MSALQRPERGSPAPRRGDDAAATADSGRSATTLDGAFDPDLYDAWQSWSRVPVEVHEALERAGLEPRSIYLCGAIPLNRAEDGDEAVEYADAWAVAYDSVLLVEAERTIARGAGPDPWRLTVRRSDFQGQVKKRDGTVPVDVGQPGNDPSSTRPDHGQPTVLEILPAPVRRQVLTTVPDPGFEDGYLIQERRGDRPYEHRAGVVRVSPHRLIAVKAVRSIEPRRRGSARDDERLLAGTAWDVQAMTADLGRAEVFHVSTDQAAQAVTARRAPELPSAGDEKSRLD